MAIIDNDILIVKSVFGIPIAALTMSETVDYIIKKIDRKEEVQHVVVNAGKIVSMQKNQLLKESVLDADIINADGQAVVWASRIFRMALPERVAGIDLMLKLIEQAHEKGLTCYFFGAKENVVSTVVKIFSKKYSDNIIAGYRSGYYSEEEEESIAIDIANSEADLLFVAMNTPKKELFINKYKSRIHIPFVMGVGGSFDVVAGVTKRAPLWMQNIGLEWFFRFLQEPRRMWKRYLVDNFKFIFLTIKYLFKK